jgi:protein phosphatase
LPRAVRALEQTFARLGADERSKVADLEARFRVKQQDIDRFVAAYRHYCWPVESVTDLKLAPFHLLAIEGRVHTDCDHVWHIKTLSEVCRADPELLLSTTYKVVDMTDQVSQDQTTAWWFEHTSQGGEGMVVKPLSFVHRGRRGLSQPAVKCRGREYLRIIYGPDYASGENLVRLRSRGLGRKRALALGEFALGVEALERFVRREPLRRVHECVFGVLALESEPVDPRL